MLVNLIKLKEGEGKGITLDTTNIPLIPKYKTVRIVLKLSEEMEGKV